MTANGCSYSQVFARTRVRRMAWRRGGRLAIIGFAAGSAAGLLIALSCVERFERIYDYHAFLLSLVYVPALYWVFIGGGIRRLPQISLVSLVVTVSCFKLLLEADKQVATMALLDLRWIMLVGVVAVEFVFVYRFLGKVRKALQSKSLTVDVALTNAMREMTTLPGVVVAAVAVELYTLWSMLVMLRLARDCDGELFEERIAVESGYSTAIVGAVVLLIVVGVALVQFLVVGLLAHLISVFIVYFGVMFLLNGFIIERYGIGLRGEFVYVSTGIRGFVKAPRQSVSVVDPAKREKVGKVVKVGLGDPIASLRLLEGVDIRGRLITRLDLRVDAESVSALRSRLCI